MDWDAHDSGKMVGFKHKKLIQSDRGHKHMEIDYISDPFLRGKENFRADFELSDNPYLPSSDGYNKWQNGFVEAQSE